MASPLVNPQRLVTQAGQAEPLEGLHGEDMVVLVPGPEEDALVADARSGLTPAQIVDQQVLARLSRGHPGMFVKATGRFGDVRRRPPD